MMGQTDAYDSSRDSTSIALCGLLHEVSLDIIHAPTFACKDMRSLRSCKKHRCPGPICHSTKGALHGGYLKSSQVQYRPSSPSVRPLQGALAALSMLWSHTALRRECNTCNQPYNPVPSCHAKRLSHLSSSLRKDDKDDRPSSAVDHCPAHSRIKAQ